MLPEFKPPSGRLQNRPRPPTPEPSASSALTIPAPVHGTTGLGDVVKRATRALGIDPCTGCRRRAETLNRWISLRPVRGGRR